MRPPCNELAHKDIGLWKNAIDCGVVQKAKSRDHEAGVLEVTPTEVTVYILRCSDGSYYTGLTKQNIEARLWEHNAGTFDGYTSRRRPVELVFTESYDRILDAIARERQIKGWNRQKKEALIAYAYEILPDLSRRGPVKRLAGAPTRPRPSRVASLPPQDEG